MLDGGLATSLENKGFDLSGRLWSAQYLLDNPEVIRDVHREHAAAGADIVTSSSYQVSKSGFAAAGYSENDYFRALELSLLIAQSAADEISYQEKRDIQVAASIGPYGATLADGSEYRGDYRVSPDFLLEFHGQRLHDITEFEPDLLAFETIPSIEEIRVINQLLTNDFRHLDAWVSCSAKSGDAISDGSLYSDVMAELNAPNIIAKGVNCTKPEYVESLIKSSSAPAIVYPNSGRTWDAANRQWLDIGSETFPDDVVQSWITSGAVIIGGCCGLETNHIAHVKMMVNA